MNENFTIMVVEDETLLLQAITKKLENGAITCVSCSGGNQAIDYLKSFPKMPDAIWLDYHLKDMNGLSFMEVLKENEIWSKIPVFVVSNSASPEKVEGMLALGAKKYFLKAEHRLDELISFIKDFITKERDEKTL
jgi:CheY-like chemotaxis protein